MLQIPWSSYKEEEIIEIIDLIFRTRGYKSYNYHKTDRRAENGVDIEFSKPTESGKIVIAVKKKPVKMDINQLHIFMNNPEKHKIYVYTEAPSGAFKEELEKYHNQLTVWDGEKLTDELIESNCDDYLKLTNEIYFERELFLVNSEIMLAFHDFLKNKDKAIEKETVDKNLLKIMWEAKDRSSSLNKSLSHFQTFFEELSIFNGDMKSGLISGFQKSMMKIHMDSIEPLARLIHEIIEDYHNIFLEFCKQTRDRSHWFTFASYRPMYLPSTIIIDKSAEGLPIQLDNDISTSYEISNVVRHMGLEAYMLENIIDDIYGIVIDNNWEMVHSLFQDHLE